MTKDLTDRAAKFSLKGLERQHADTFALRSYLDKLKPKDPVASRLDAVKKAKVEDKIGKIAAEVRKMHDLLDAIAAADTPELPAAIAKAASAIESALDKELKAVGKAGPFPNTEAAIKDAIAAYEKEAKLSEKATEAARQVWSPLRFEASVESEMLGKNAIRVLDATRVLLKDADKTPRKMEAQNLQNNAMGLENAAEYLEKYRVSAMKHADNIMELWRSMEADQLQSADNMKAPNYLLDLVKARAKGP